MRERRRRRRGWALDWLVGLSCIYVLLASVRGDFFFSFFFTCECEKRKSIFVVWIWREKEIEKDE